MERFDTLVLGLGAMGSATAYQLAKRGNKVVGIDRFALPHVFGSSHGDTRITRLAIGEGVHYTPLVQRSHEIWREIERESGAELLSSVGGLIISSPAKTSMLHVPDFFANTVAAAKKYGIAHQLLDAREIRARFPQFRIEDDEVGYYEPEAGYLRPEECIRAQLKLAAAHGATLRPNEKVLAFEPFDRDVMVVTEKSRYLVDKLVLSAGPWLPQLVDSQYARHFKIFRQLLFWFDVNGPIEPFLPGNCPIFIWELQGTQQAIYGFPAVDGAKGGVKVATQQYERETTADTAKLEVGAEEAAAMYRSHVAPYLPGLSEKCLKAVACLYTVTRDSGFVIDVHPESDRIIIASPCSGHGFKHSAAIGEALADLATTGATRFDLSAFKLARL
jgi:sarcosine oxidase